MNQEDRQSTPRCLVWDIPTRLAHLLLIIGFLGAFILAEAGEHGPLFVLHMVLGLLVALIAILRILWGIVGTRYARFSSFSWRPSALLSYLRNLVSGGDASHVGHNPATSYATIAMLALALGIAASGLMMTRGFGEELEDLHEVLALALLAIAAVHVAGVLFHVVRHRDDLVRSMVDGRKAAARQSESASPARAAGATLALLTAGLLVVALTGYDPARGTVVVPGLGWTLGEEDSERGGGDARDDHADRVRDNEDHSSSKRDDHDDHHRGARKHRDNDDHH